eukprot:TRINITY_DN43408_c0_g1_i3.p1 TRINITY_DN43408_c0_g1~~TRINITY_DN43408_c0_g1_i3.p1  ORF type:complete len:637 (-),score=118.37 TRINITY_DN43408_c0_g1_i3:410-2275(-)
MARFLPIPIFCFLSLVVVDAVPWGDATISNGCFMWGWRDPDADVELTGDFGDVPKCHKACLEREDCTTFVLLAGKCFVGTTGRFGENLVRSESSTLSGPRVCATPSASCAQNNIPSGLFPADTESESMAAWEKTGFQPQEMMCWEKDSNSQYLQCPETTTLETITEVGGCMNLVKSALSAQECESSCKSQMSCAMWVTTIDSCYTSTGDDCAASQTAVSGVVSGARILRGSSRVLRSWLHVKIKNLDQAFSATRMNQLTAAGKDATAVCKNICLSILDCQYWQLFDDAGCYIEKTANYGETVAYPLTTAGTEADLQQVAGEYIQRFCPSQIGVESSTTTSTTSATTATTTTTTTTTSNPLVLDGTAGRSSRSKSSGSGDSGSGDSGSGNSGSGDSGSADSLSAGSGSGSGSLASSSGGSDSSGSGGSGSGNSFDSSGTDVSGSGDSGSDGSDSSNSWPWWSWGLCFFLLLCCLIGCIGLAFLALHGFDKKPPKRKRPQQPQQVTVDPRLQEQAYMQGQVYAAPSPAPQYVAQDPVPTSTTQMPMYRPVQYVPGYTQSQQQLASSQRQLPMLQQQQFGGPQQTPGQQQFPGQQPFLFQQQFPVEQQFSAQQQFPIDQQFLSR